jgi:hypothetical protein
MTCGIAAIKSAKKVSSAGLLYLQCRNLTERKLKGRLHRMLKREPVQERI